MPQKSQLFLLLASQNLRTATARSRLSFLSAHALALLAYPQDNQPP